MAKGDGSTLSFVLARFNKCSVIMASLAVGLCALVGIIWWRLLLHNLSVVDSFLLGLWVFMVAALSWDVRVEKDVPLALCAAAGGLLIEWWGTNSELWRYFTNEQPPLWIVGAWPIAALSTERMAFVLERALSSRASPAAASGAVRDAAVWRVTYWLVLPAFVAGMTRFIWPSIDLGTSQAVVGLMVLATVTGRAAKRDLLLFACGSVLGIFLEYWGTSRQCWTYHTAEVPPLAAVLAHGFASVSFARAASVLGWFGGKVGLPWSVGPRLGAHASM
jgi:hypothetical protein